MQINHKQTVLKLSELVHLYYTFSYAYLIKISENSNIVLNICFLIF